ncbi:MAG: RagB/SusD family nutrient uptake outer membrane protein [Bacteroidales bacterium]|nr:RagB/SusD family nutrient uptake outer membrane protein [Bacteroidales bacterium]
MKISQYILASIITALGLTSCELDRLDYTEISEDTFPQNENDCKLAVNYLYYDFNTGWWDGVYAADYGGYQVLSDMTTDVLWTCWAWESDEMYYHQWFATMNGNFQNNIWDCFSRYNYLSKARNTIRRIERSSASDEAKALYAGEAHALRGWMALFLYDLFGPVPVASDEILDDPETFYYLPRLTDEEYDAMMEEDLLTAIETLPAVPEATGRMSKGAARMILLKYYMIRGLFEKAEKVARDLVAMEGTYSLQSDYNYIFSKSGNGNNEVILCIPSTNTDSGYNNYMTAEVLPADYPWAEKAEGWGGYVMPWDFYNTFEPGDQRAENIIASYYNKKGVLVDSSSSAQLAKGALPLKYGMDPEQTGSASGVDVVIYRFSDALLSLAECVVRNNHSVTSEAVSLVNRIRNRAGLPDLDASATSNYDSFMEALLKERGHEFWLEGLRRQDLIRFDKYIEYANQRIENANAAGSSYFKVTDCQNRFWIPQSFIDESKSQIKQNPGY